MKHGKFDKPKVKTATLKSLTFLFKNVLVRFIFSVFQAGCFIIRFTRLLSL